MSNVNETRVASNVSTEQMLKTVKQFIASDKLGTEELRKLYAVARSVNYEYIDKAKESRDRYHARSKMLRELTAELSPSEIIARLTANKSA